MDYQELQKKLQTEGVDILEFPSWLMQREKLANLGLGKVFNPTRRVPDDNELKMERSYQYLKEHDVDVNDFAMWLRSSLYEVKK